MKKKMKTIKIKEVDRTYFMGGREIRKLDKVLIDKSKEIINKDNFDFTKIEIKETLYDTEIIIYGRLEKND